MPEVPLADLFPRPESRTRFTVELCPMNGEAGWYMVTLENGAAFTMMHGCPGNAVHSWLTQWLGAVAEQDAKKPARP